MPDYWFFLSYARRDSKGERYLRKFYTDLALRVSKIAGLPSQARENEIAFFDEQGVEPGDEWDSKIAEGLQTSRVFLCLYSRAYFNSHYCGQEFQAFQDRVKAYVIKPGSEPFRPMLPVLWGDPKFLSQNLPRSVSRLQDRHVDFGQLYSEEGLEYIMRLEKSVEYQEFLTRLAGRIVHQAESHRLPRVASFRFLKDVENAFEENSHRKVDAGHASPDTSGTPVNEGPGVAWFVYLAGRDIDYRSIRTNIGSYGHFGGGSWMPYRPPIQKRIGVLSQTIAAEEDLLLESPSVDDRLVFRLREAEERNTIIIVVVDPWSVRVESLKRFLLAYDQTRLSNCALLIVWNENDEETTSNTADLQSELMRTLFRTWESGDTFFRARVCNEEDLKREITAAINDIRLRLIRRARLFRPVGRGENTPFPTIAGPATTGAR